MVVEYCPSWIKVWKDDWKFKRRDLHMQEYRNSSELSKCEQQLLFAVRCRSHYVKSSYKSQFKSDMTCRSCFDPMSYEDLDHIVKSCLKFKDLIGDEKLSFNDVYGSLQDQIKFWWELKQGTFLHCIRKCEYLFFLGYTYI